MKWGRLVNGVVHGVGPGSLGKSGLNLAIKSSMEIGDVSRTMSSQVFTDAKVAVSEHDTKAPMTARKQPSAGRQQAG